MEKKLLSEFEVQAADGKKRTLSDYAGKVVLVVNVASKCGFTPQYRGLQELYETYWDQGFMILGFPCNQFGSQEPGADSEIQAFCDVNYSVTFPVLSKVDVNGADAAPLYKWLKESKPGVLGIEAIKWNFTKFLISRKGEVINRYSPQTSPKSIAGDIEEALKG